MAGYLPCTFNYLFDGKAHAVSQVKDVAFTAPVQVENIEELVNKAVSYEEDSEHPTLDEFLEQVALVADIDLSLIHI